MTKITRRDFLKQSALGLGAAVAGSMLPDNDPNFLHQQMGELDIDELNADDNEVFVEGVVLEIEGDRLVVRDERTTVVLVITEQTRLWKGKVTSLDEVEPGDFIYARALPGDDDNLLALKIWANIVNIYGTIENVQNDSLALRFGGAKSKVRFVIHTTADTLINEVEKSNNNHLIFRPDQIVQVVGVYQKESNILATRIWIND